MNPDTQYQDRVMALAGMFQATSLVSRIAGQGIIDAAPFAASIDSIFTMDADTMENVYGGVANLKTGLNVICRQLGQTKEPVDKDVTSYTVGLIHLEHKLLKNRPMLDTLSEGIRAAQTTTDMFHSTHSNIIARLADIYSKTISTLGPRIMVHGEPVHLNNPENANRIRALLLAGVRSTVLWRQKGGGRLNLLLARKRILRIASEMLIDE